MSLPGSFTIEMVLPGDLADYFPKYLTEGNKKLLQEQLESFPDIPYYLEESPFPAKILQGDCWRGLEVVRAEPLESKQVRAVVLSNTCDLDPDNQRPIEARAVYSPLVKLRKIEELLRKKGLDERRIADFLVAVRAQKRNSIFYLPELPGVIDESVVSLDDLHSGSARRILSRRPERVFTLSQSAYWLFLLKISIHFLRFQEGISRFS